jgi:hypothetical protein
LLYNFVITTEVEADDAIVYTTEKTITRAEYEQQVITYGINIKDLPLLVSRVQYVWVQLMRAKLKEKDFIVILETE